MKIFLTLALFILSSSCTLKTFVIPQAPLTDNRAIVFDIDGTLTPNVSSIFTARKGASDAVNLYASRGYKIIYLSARFRFLQSGIPDWLKENGFPEGSIQVPQSSADSSDHAAFKARVLEGFKINGWHFVAAYGDSSTDFDAYSAVGIEKENIFALKRAGEATCLPGSWSKCLNSWTEHIETIKRQI